MKNKALYEKTVSILVQAYFNNTLHHGNPYCCVIGNLIADNMGIAYCINEDTVKIEFIDDVDPNKYGLEYADGSSPDWYGMVNPLGWVNNGMGDLQIASTGYCLAEIIKIENAFEMEDESEGDKVFNGLMAVINTLDQIHDNNDTVITTFSKQRFHKIQVS
jgi:hypothetical protein